MATFKRIITSILLVTCLLTLGIEPGAAQQAATSIRVSFSEVSEGEDALTLGVYFTLLDASGQPVTDAQIQSAEIILLDNGAHSEASYGRADTPFYIVMVLDASGSMMRAGEDLRKAAAQAISNAPAGARFAVVRFNDQIDTLVDFTESRDQIERAISQVQPVNNAGTCLYDSTYQALEMLAKTPPGRRAVILFTDGKDETAQGGPCSVHVFDEVVDFANRADMHVPINTIGMAANVSAVNAAELESMASTTGGFTVVGSQSSLGPMFEQIMDALASQWLVQARLYPTKGRHEAAIQIVLRDGTTLSATVSFEASRDYLLPPSANLERVQYKADAQAYTLFLTYTSPQLIDHLKVAVWDTKNGVQVAEYEFRNLPATQTMEIPTDELEAGRDYEFRIAALDPGGQSVSDAEGKPIALTHKFRYDPEVVQTRLVISSVTIKDQELFVDVDLTDAGEVTSFEGWLNDRSTNAQVADSAFTTPPKPTVRIPLTGLAAGKYTVVLKALDGQGKVVAEAEYEDVAFTPPAPPSRASVLFERLVSGLKANAWILIAMVGVILFMMVALIAIPLIARRQTGTPVLQGKIEANLGGSSTPSPVNLTRMEKLEKPKAAIKEPRVKSAPPAPPAASPAGATMIETPAQPISIPSAVLRVVRTPDPGQQQAVFKLGLTPLAVGRENCDLLFEGDRKISRRHAVIAYEPSSRRYTVTDLGSANGVFVNGTRAPANQPMFLSNGAVVQFGPETQVVFEQGS